MYEIRAVDTSIEGISECCNLLKTVFPDATNFTNEYLDWLYNQNPVGSAIGFNAFDGQELVAHYVTIPVIARLFEKQSYGLLSLNTATHPAHWGKRLFTTLANSTYAQGADLGYEFVIGVGNEISTPGFIKMGFQSVGKLEAKIGFGNIKIKRARSKVEFEPVWDKERLEWRCKNPENIYRLNKVGRVTQLLASTGKFGIQAILGEFDDAIDYPLIPQLNSEFYLFKLWLGLDCNINWFGTSYINVPNRLRLSPLNLIFKDLTGKNRILSAKKISFHAIDFDAY
jgi:hypothetical protein